MPAIVGPVQIVNVSGGIVQFGDTLNISPKTAEKIYSGQGALNTGGLVITNSGLNGTNVLDTNIIDQPITGNN